MLHILFGVLGVLVLALNVIFAIRFLRSIRKAETEALLESYRECKKAASQHGSDPAFAEYMIENAEQAKSELTRLGYKGPLD